MKEIPPPTVSTRDENRYLFCQMAVELPLQDFIESAVKAGWDRKEVLAAVIDAVDNLMPAAGANTEVVAAAWAPTEAGMIAVALRQ
ncbi:hypothetical protein ABK249_23045 [Neorhizobium sp. Rsf11]|uniref:Uncharacterized protein n=1 Tax=Neorhizobium phenanthreniclasticum TaxID=3157917 RepID=A0ABV0M7T0_9HYPH